MDSYDIDDFTTDVLERSYQNPILVDFWAEWCGPCKIIGPVLERLAEQASDWELRKLDTEKHPEVAAQYRITSIPAVKLFVDGEVENEFTGALPEQMIQDWLTKALPSKNRAKVTEAQHLISNQRVDKARIVLEEIIEDEPTNDHAKILLAHIDIWANPLNAIELANEVTLDSEYSDKAQAIKKILGLFNHLDAPELLEESPIKGQYLEAINFLMQKNFTGSLESFIEVIKRNRYYDSDSSREACIAIFNLLGEDHETTRAYRNLFSNSLY